VKQLGPQSNGLPPHNLPDLAGTYAVAGAKPIAVETADGATTIRTCQGPAFAAYPANWRARRPRTGLPSGLYEERGRCHGSPHWSHRRSA
jgi:hypothetical protein